MASEYQKRLAKMSEGGRAAVEARLKGVSGIVQLSQEDFLDQRLTEIEPSGFSVQTSSCTKKDHLPSVSPGDRPAPRTTEAEFSHEGTPGPNSGLQSSVHVQQLEQQPEHSKADPDLAHYLGEHKHLSAGSSRGLTVVVKLDAGSPGEERKTGDIMVAQKSFQQSREDEGSRVAAGQVVTVEREGSRGWVLVRKGVAGAAEPKDGPGATWGSKLVWYPASWGARFPGVEYAYPQGGAAGRLHPVLVSGDLARAVALAREAASAARQVREVPMNAMNAGCGPAGSALESKDMTSGQGQHGASSAASEQPTAQVDVAMGSLESFLGASCNGQGALTRAHRQGLLAKGLCKSSSAPRVLI